MAARSSPSCKFFVLPCCFYDFSSRFSLNRLPANISRTSTENGGNGRYRLYLDWIKTVIERCGFVAEEDCLRVPSTKNYAFIGRSSAYEASQREEVLQCIDEMVSKASFQPKPLVTRETIQFNH